MVRRRLGLLFKYRQSGTVPVSRLGEHHTVHDFEKRNIIRSGAQTDLRYMSVRHRESLRQNPNSARDMIVSRNDRVTIPPRHAPAERLDRLFKYPHVAMNDAKRFTILTLFRKLRMKLRHPGVLGQFCGSHFVEASYDTTRHLGGVLKVADELIIRGPEFENIVPTPADCSERKRQVSLGKKMRREEDRAASFDNEWIAYSGNVAPEFNFGASLVCNKDEGNSFVANTLEYGSGGSRGVCQRINQGPPQVAKKNLHGCSSADPRIEYDTVDTVEQ